MVAALLAYQKLFFLFIFDSHDFLLTTMQQIGGSGVLISPLTYIFDEETPRWRQLLSKLGL